MSSKKNILIVGATGAMGSSLAKQLTKDPSVQLILMARNIQKLNVLSDELGNDPFLIPLNLLGATPKVRTEIEKNCGAIHAIIFASGDVGSLTPIEHYDVGQWYNLMQVNLHAPFLMVQILLPLLKQADTAHIVFLHDEIAMQPKAYWGAYSIAEAGKLQFAHLLKAECDASIHVHSLFLSRFKSGITQKAFPGMFLEGTHPFPEAAVHVDKILALL